MRRSDDNNSINLNEMKAWGGVHDTHGLGFMMPMGWGSRYPWGGVHDTHGVGSRCHWVGFTMSMGVGFTMPM